MFIFTEMFGHAVAGIGVGFVLSLPLAVGVSGLEIIVVVVQAYVFTLLTRFYRHGDSRASLSSLTDTGQGEIMGGLAIALHGSGYRAGLVVIGAGLGIGKLAAGAAEAIGRQPSAAAQITGAVNLPLFLLEGVAILAEVFALLIVLKK